jgi:magnesium-transporting ATPase (P-type)
LNCYLTTAGDAKETGLALLLLFVFALFSSGYVLKEGLRKKEKTTHELLLKCVIIITSVVPRQLPMQMAMAVNMALMALGKAGIFCTEPYRVPLAGKVSHCLFDKTGTLTTDQLVPVGIVNHNSASVAGTASSASSSSSAAGGGGGATFTGTSGSSVSAGSNKFMVEHGLPALGEVITATAETAMILAACHSLIVVDDGAAAAAAVPDPATAAESSEEEACMAAYTAAAAANANLVGDPIELAAIKAIDWAWDPASSTASPNGGIIRVSLALSLARQQLKGLENSNNSGDAQAAAVNPAAAAAAPAARKTKIENCKREIAILEGKLKDSTAKAEAAMFSAVQVMHRHHFSSKLQRMSVVCRCSHGGSNSSTSAKKGNTLFVLCLLCKEIVTLFATIGFFSLHLKKTQVL